MRSVMLNCTRAGDCAIFGGGTGSSARPLDSVCSQRFRTGRLPGSTVWPPSTCGDRWPSYKPKPATVPDNVSVGVYGICRAAAASTRLCTLLPLATVRPRETSHALIMSSQWVA